MKKQEITSNPLVSQMTAKVKELRDQERATLQAMEQLKQTKEAIIMEAVTTVKELCLPGEIEEKIQAELTSHLMEVSAILQSQLQLFLEEQRTNLSKYLEEQQSEIKKLSCELDKYVTLLRKLQ